MAIEGLLEDILLSGTVLRGLVKQGPFSLLGYLGVPDGHWAARAEELHFECHGGITFQAEGDGVLLPAGWYWYGWDYAHAWDRLALPADMLSELPEDLSALFQARFSNGKAWTQEEVKEELFDSAIRLWQMLSTTERTCIQAGLGTKTSNCDELFVWVPNPE